MRLSIGMINTSNNNVYEGGDRFRSKVTFAARSAKKSSNLSRLINDVRLVYAR